MASYHAAHTSDVEDDSDVFEPALEDPDIPSYYRGLYADDEGLDALNGNDDDDSDYVDDEGGEEEDEHFHDAQTGDIEVEIEIEEEDDDDDDEDEEGNGAEEDEDEAGEEGPETGMRRRIMRLIGGRTGPGFLTHRQLLLLLRGQDLGHVLFNDMDDEDDAYYLRRRRHPPDPNRFPKVPSEEGVKLMSSGVFGSGEQVTSKSFQAKKHVARRLLDRELGMGDRGHRHRNQAAMAHSLIPSTDPEMIIRYESPVFSGQFSDDGNFFFSVVKDFRVRMYDTSNPYNWRHYKTVEFPFGQWTLTDASLSPDNKWLAYTSITPKVCLAPTDPNDTGDPYTLDLSGSDGTVAGNAWRNDYRAFGIWSVRFSGDGRELVAGTNVDSLIVFDIESRRVLHSIRGHDDDVNAVCFADKLSPHLLYSGSDDATIKVWDRRSMGDRREAGAFVGHCEGLTYIDSKGDGRYVLSNGKDQCMKLWDLRMAMSTADFAAKNPRRHTQGSDFDYRWNEFDDDMWFKHPDDNSLVTFRGHRVQRTLIRCHFSPPASTDSRYVYSGSHDGKVYVWNLDATLAAKIDVREATSRMLPPRYRNHAGYSRWSTCVREASWHPNAPVLVASAWNGSNMDFGTCTVHSWNDSKDDEAEPKMGWRVDEKLQPFGSRPHERPPLIDLLWDRDR